MKGKSIPKVAALVEAMFVAELKNLLLTAGHDADTLEGEVTLGISDGQAGYRLMNGKAQVTKAGDMQMADRRGIISSIIYGPDHRTQITKKTTHVLFTVYAPPGVEPAQVAQHLQDIKQLVGLFSPNMQVERNEVFSVGEG